MTESGTATTAGNYFVANYPPFSFWKPEHVPAARSVLERPAGAARPLGLYVHLPFCRKRCDFCYYKVYTDKDSKQIRRYLNAVLEELRAHAALPFARDRQLSFVYFGGGTPSYLSVEQLQFLIGGMRAIFPWEVAREITFECEPGTLQESKMRALRELDVTRLSFGIENFDAGILELNNRAHRAREIYRAYDFARQVGFPQINVDLIAGMVGETDENWAFCIEETRRLAPESVTIYQMEIPYNTTIYQQMKHGGTAVAPVADWPTKRRWAGEAFAALEEDGYLIGSAYTAKKSAAMQFLYRDALWTGADLLGIGVSSFSHVAGTHFQNEHDFGPYLERVEAGDLPIHRALTLSEEEKLTREFVLQMKLGVLHASYFQDKFGVDVLERFEAPLRKHERDGYLRLHQDRVEATREGLLQIDRLLHDFFLEPHRNARYS